ncbi:serine/threonine protein kinase, CMGC, dual-specificity, partial [Cryomyces antarcticus]
MGPPRHNGMPPPRLPASATWSGPMNGIHSSPASTSARPSFESGKRQNSTSALVSERDSAKVKTPRTGWTTVSHHPPISQDAASSAARSASSSILTPMHRMLGSKGSLGGLKARTPETGSDKDDLAADEEMRKLGSKRRDFETAAKELDELRKRAVPRERVGGAQALQKGNLNIFERGEIIDYKDIYFCGTGSAKKHIGNLNAQTLNFGYDDDRGDYNIVLGDHLAYRYEVVD